MCVFDIYEQKNTIILREGGWKKNTLINNGEIKKYKYDLMLSLKLKTEFLAYKMFFLAFIFFSLLCIDK